eukprot:TRINITY_DN5089_c0_g1_i1.p1 TRINITY_DN5089_c0_g1~~TRINITY_DN5089_c0_g1_i1.p1  ORF type:complete len:453 (+),score=97.37 TRINITY_DN5089_c0_g1_i1:47-1360(+)
MADSGVDFSAIDFALIEPAQIRQQLMPWSAYKTIVDENVVSLMANYDKKAESFQDRELAKRGDEYAKAFISLLVNLHHVEPLQYILTTVADVLQADPSRVALFHGLYPAIDPYQPFLRLLTRNNWYVLKTAVDILSTLLSSTDYAVPRPVHDGLVRWLARLISVPNLPEHATVAAISALTKVLRVQPNRLTFVQAGGVGQLAPLLEKFKDNVPMMYNVCFALWLLSYNETAADAFNAPGMLQGLVEICRAAVKEKIVRISLSILRNLVARGKLNEDLIDLGLHKTVASLASRKWTDDDIIDDLTFMGDSLRQGVKELSTFEKYQKEVTGGRMDWTPMHTSDQFWQENINRFEAKDFEIVRVIVSFIKRETPITALCVALNDVGEFSKYHARGRQILNDFHAKERIMDLLSHEDSQVRKHALLAIQKLLVTKHTFAAS